MITSIYELVDELPEIGIPIASDGERWIVISVDNLPRASVVLGETYPKRAAYIRELFEDGSVEKIRQLCLGEFNGIEKDFFDAFIEETGCDKPMEKVRVTAVEDDEEEEVFQDAEIIEEDDFQMEDEEEVIKGVDEEMGDSFETVQLKGTVDRLRATIKRLKEENKALKESGGVVEEETIDQETLEFCYGTLLETDEATLHGSVMQALDKYIEEGKEEELTKTLLAVFGCMSDTGVL